MKVKRDGDDDHDEALSIMEFGYMFNDWSKNRIYGSEIQTVKEQDRRDGIR